jgi:hypothetical protein
MRADRVQRELLLFLSAGHRGLGGLGFGHALLELIHAAGGIDELLLAGIEGVTNVANTHDDHRPRGAGLDDVATGATDFRLHIFRMNLSFHKRPEKLSAAREMTSAKLR